MLEIVNTIAGWRDAHVCRALGVHVVGEDFLCFHCFVPIHFHNAHSQRLAVFGEPRDAALRCAASCLVCDCVVMCVWGKHSR